MNFGGSKDLNCIKIDPWTGEKFSFNLDIISATAWQHPQQWHGQEASEALDDFIFFTSDQKTALIDRKLMAYKLLRFQTVAKYTFRNQF